MKQQDTTSAVPIDPPPSASVQDDLHAQWRRVVGRRSFLRGVGVAGAAAVPASALFASSAMAKSGASTAGDVAILRFLGGVDGGNPAYMAALSNLDGDMPQYIADNTDDELSHANFLNGYLKSKGAP